MISLKITPVVYIDPPSSVYYADRLFDINDAILNRDDSLLPYVQLRAALYASGVTHVHTADQLPHEISSHQCDYYSLGILKNFRKLRLRKDVRLRAFIIFEPPVVEPKLYAALPELTDAFDFVYIHNINGDGYSLDGVNQTKLRKFYWPQPRKDIIELYWNHHTRLHQIVVINGHHIPKKVPNELYSKRIEAMACLASSGVIQLYGRGWDKWWSRASMWWPYWQHRRKLMSIYKGACESKYAILSQYKFSLCFENIIMQGCITEKIFDCIYAGSIPLYLGAPNIQDLIPSNCYIDCRKFLNWDALLQYIIELDDNTINEIRMNGRRFITSSASREFKNSLLKVFNISNATP